MFLFSATFNNYSRGDGKRLTSQLRDLISQACPGSASGSPLDGHAHTLGLVVFSLEKGTKPSELCHMVGTAAYLLDGT